jgi:hypothetical protein
MPGESVLATGPIVGQPPEDIVALLARVSMPGRGISLAGLFVVATFRAKNQLRANRYFQGEEIRMVLEIDLTVGKVAGISRLPNRVKNGRVIVRYQHEPRA